jgi:cation diffusion facilitator CzcD-associated flavoprotein CzcO
MRPEGPLIKRYLHPRRLSVVSYFRPLLYHEAMPNTLAELERDVARDLKLVAHPRAAWMRSRRRRNATVLDVLIVGGGQSGLAIAFGLMRDKVENILVIDRARYGREGPWVTYARMPTLRSLKDQTGPDLGIPSLTYQSWHEAQRGPADFEALRWVRTQDWNDYLLWFRGVTGLPVRNEADLVRIDPDHDDEGTSCLRAGLGDGSVLYARKIVLATGQDGGGHWWMPEFLARLPARYRAHTVDEIDFASLRGRVVAVLGAGASAFDNAATALEAGASQVHLFCRRSEPMIIQPFRWLTFTGFLRHIGEMDDAWRWRFMHYIFGLREGFPADTYARVKAHDNFSMHVGEGWEAAEPQGERLRITTTVGPFDADFAIAGTGVMHDLTHRPELAGCAANIALWRDRYTPPPAERHPRLELCPYLAADYTFMEREPGLTPWVRDIHFFGVGTAASFGPAGASINAMSIAVPKLVAGVTRALFRADIAEHWGSLRAYDVKQVEL